MHPLTRIIQEDMKPALGVTEPGAIAYAAAVARSRTRGPIVRIELELNSGLYKNAFTCGVPNSDGMGGAFAAALGATAGDPGRGLEALSGAGPEDETAARALTDRGAVRVRLGRICSDIRLKAAVITDRDTCEVTIRDTHTGLSEIRRNGEVVFRKDDPPGGPDGRASDPGGSGVPEDALGSYTLKGMLEYAESVDTEETAFLREAYRMNLELFEAGLGSPKAVFAPRLYAQNNNRRISPDARATAQLLCGAAIEGRVAGLGKPAMSVAGSGAHGILCTLPLYALCEAEGLPEERLLRATALSCLVTLYIKERSGRLSAFCGCAIAAGTGAACGLAFLRGASYEGICGTLDNMASGVTGMICDGGNQGCVMKGVVAVDAAFRASDLAVAGARVSSVHGILGDGPERTMRNMGLIASPGMTGTEKTILDILRDKENRGRSAP